MRVTFTFQENNNNIPYMAKGAVKKQSEKKEATNLQKSRNVASFVV